MNKSTLQRKMSHDDPIGKSKINSNVTMGRRLAVSSSLSGSVTSLTSSSSHSRTSSTQDDQLSSSSSSASLSSPTASQAQTMSVLTDRNSTSNGATPFVDRRKAVGGKIKPFVPDYTGDQERRFMRASNGKGSTTAKRQNSTQISGQKRKSLQLTIISENQIKKTAKLGKDLEFDCFRYKSILIMGFFFQVKVNSEKFMKVSIMMMQQIKQAYQ